MFDDFTIEERSTDVRRKGNGVVVSSRLDFSLVSRPEMGTHQARRMMLRRLKQYFINKPAVYIRKADYEKFLGNPDNFGATYRKKQLPDVPRWDDPKILKETQDRELQKELEEEEFFGEGLDEGLRQRIEAAVHLKEIRRRVASGARIVKHRISRANKALGR